MSSGCTANIVDQLGSRSASREREERRGGASGWLLECPIGRWEVRRTRIVLVGSTRKKSECVCVREREKECPRLERECVWRMRSAVAQSTSLSLSLLLTIGPARDETPRDSSGGGGGKEGGVRYGTCLPPSPPPLPPAAKAREAGWHGVVVAEEEEVPHMISSIFFLFLCSVLGSTDVAF